jgi:DNA-binding NarL/FixJ family response regulator
LAARLVAAADVYAAMTQTRPYRAALSGEQAAGELHRMADSGQLDHDAVAAVVTEAGQQTRRARRVRPAGLSDREVEVLALIAKGCSNADVAERLVISRRTAEHHAQHIYTKIGVSTRAAAALFAVEHDLVRPE